MYQPAMKWIVPGAVLLATLSNPVRSAPDRRPRQHQVNTRDRVKGAATRTSKETPPTAI